MAYESLEICVTCEGSGTAHMDLEDFCLADFEEETLEGKLAGISDIEGLLGLISEYCDGYPGDLVKRGKSDWFVDALRAMDFKKLKTLEFRQFTSDFDIPVEEPPLETYMNLVYDFTEGKAKYSYEEC